jgi:hypothetical protein
MHKRFEFRFNKNALMPQMGINKTVEYKDKIPTKYWLWRASLVIDYSDKKIIKDREGLFDSYNKFIERN